VSSHLYKTKSLLCYNAIVLFDTQTKLAADFKMHKLKNRWFVADLQHELEIIHSVHFFSHQLAKFNQKADEQLFMQILLY